MIATMWAEEASDGNRTYGFLAAGLTEPFITDPRGLLTNEMIKACGGQPEDAVSAAIDRIDSNLHQLTPDYISLSADISISLGHLRVTSSALHGAFVMASRSMAIMVNVMAHLLSSTCPCSAVEQFSLLCLCTAFIIHQMQSPLGARRVREALDIDVLQLMLRSSQLCNNTLPDYHRFNNISAAILLDVMPRYFLHQSLLSRVTRSLASIKALNLESQMHRGEPFEISWLKCMELAKQRWKQYKEYKESPDAAFVCGNPECGRFENDKHRLLRCAGCALLRYCGRRCQKRHWKGTHRRLCKDVQSRHRDLDPVVLSNPDLKFLGHVVARDFHTHRDNLEGYKARYLKSHKLANNFSVPLPAFDYDDPVELKIKISDSAKPSIFSPFSCEGKEEVLSEWCKALKPIDYDKGKMVPLVVFVPRGDCPQVMTALLTLRRMPKLGSNPPKFSSQLTGISWIHST